MRRSRKPLYPQGYRDELSRVLKDCLSTFLVSRPPYSQNSTKSSNLGSNAVILEGHFPSYVFDYISLALPVPDFSFNKLLFGIHLEFTAFVTLVLRHSSSPGLNKAGVCTKMLTSHRKHLKESSKPLQVTVEMPGFLRLSKSYLVLQPLLSSDWLLLFRQQYSGGIER